MERQLSGHEVVRVMPVPTLVLDGEGRLLFVSESWRRLLRDIAVDEAERLLPGAHLFAVLDEWSTRAPALSPVTAELRAALEQDRPGSSELAVPFPSGPRWFIVAASTLSTPPARLLVTLTDITARRATEAQLEHQALHDVLTGLPNRAMLNERLRRVPPPDAPDGMSVFFLDLDDFKQVNDTLGHEAGDAVLVEVARRLRSCVRENDFVARLGGDEFVVVAEGLVGDVEALAYADRLAESLLGDIPVLGRVVTTSASIGVATASGRPSDAHESHRGHDTHPLVRYADVAMLQAKAAGRGQVGFDRALNLARRRRTDEVQRLRQALQDGDVHAQFQPVVRLDDSTVVAAEALARWTGRDGRQLGADEFIPLAERTGLISSIDHTMIWAAAQALVSGALGGVDLRCSVNTSPKQVPGGLLLEDVLAVLHETGLDPRRLTVEITETAVLGDPTAAIEQLRQVKAAGIEISLDDFGTGFSSLTHVTTLPIDALKVDRSFVARMLTDVRAHEVIRLVVELGRTLAIDVVAEGIETVEQRDALRALGCPLGQGFLYGPAVPADEFSELAASLPGAG